MLTITITSLSHAGEGIGRHEGRAIFVPFALPGESVRVEVVEEKKGFARARLLEVLAPAQERIRPLCPHHFTLEPAPGFASDSLAGACGGCQLQHMDYAAQLRFKQQQVVEQLRRIGKFAEPPVRPALASPNPFYYRNHVQFAPAAEGGLGFRAAGSRRVVAIRECHQIEPGLTELFARVRVEASQSPLIERVALRAGAGDERLVVLELGDDAPEVELDLDVSAALLRTDGTALPLAGPDHVLYQVRGRSFRVSAGSFFQVNTPMAEVLVDLVLTGVNLAGGEAVLDLYCGVGLFSAFMAPLARRVVGVEAFEPAVRDAALNLDEFDNIEIYQAPVEQVLPGLEGPFEAAVLDPPRAGCHPAVLDALSSSAVARIVYVSCDAATLARDARRLAQAGWGLDDVQPLDMFPQTYHVECVAVLSRN
jgi:23S rRNA (uracil1939-C5)-methyltransferase